ncbi:MAG TPA: DUF397 domain-containing protein [Pseudonocardiaceae bacterium]
MTTQTGTASFGAWRKSSYSHPNGNQCVEVAWRKSSYSHPQNACVEVGMGPAGVGVRDSKNPTGPVLALPAGCWTRFLSSVA